MHFFCIFFKISSVYAISSRSGVKRNAPTGLEFRAKVHIRDVHPMLDRLKQLAMLYILD